MVIFIALLHNILGISISIFIALKCVFGHEPGNVFRLNCIKSNISNFIFQITEQAGQFLVF